MLILLSLVNVIRGGSIEKQWWNIAIPIITGLIGLTLLRYLKTETTAWYWTIVAIIIRGLGMVIVRVALPASTPQIERSTVMNVFALASMVLITMTLVDYFSRRSSTWGRYKAYGDAIFIMILVLMLGLNAVLGGMNLQQVGIGVAVVAVLLLLTNLIVFTTLTSIVVFFEHSGNKTARIIFAIGVTLLLIVDMMRIYQQFNPPLYPMVVLNFFHSTAMTITAWGVISAAWNPTFLEPSTQEEHPSVKINWIPTVLIVIGALLAAFGFMDWVVVMRMVVVGLFYLLVLWLIRVLQENENLLFRVRNQSSELEVEVDECTKELLAANNELERLANTDQLTGMGSRRYMFAEMEKKIAANEPFTIFYIDTVRFQLINDMHGNEIGDKVLKELGGRALSFADQSLVTARLGGDEFAALYPSIDAETIDLVGHQIIDEIEKPVIIGDNQFKLSATMGIARYPRDAKTIDGMIRCADMAMQKAKDDPAYGRFVVYSNELEATVERRMWLEYLLQHMDPDQNFLLHYQPQIEIGSGKLVGMEALLRWYHPDYGFVSPRDFIPVAEESGLITKISQWSIEHALQQTKIWKDKYPQDYSMSINFSPRFFNYVNLYDMLDDLIKKYKVDPKWIDIEITEYSDITTDAISETVGRLSDIGFSISLDDFGTG